MIDTHAHLYYPALANQLGDVLDAARAVGVDRVVVPATTGESLTSTVDVCELSDSLYAGVGIHPTEADSYSDEHRGKIKELLEGANSIVSIGEVGLDYYHFEEEKTESEIEAKKSIQKTVFQEMMGLAAGYGLPLIIHSREAFADTYSLLAAQKQPAVIHCFASTEEEAEAWLDLGFYLSVTGMITYKKNEALREVVRSVPLERLFLETDAPYLAPEGFRGKICEPKHARQVAECIAEVKGISLEEVDRVTTAAAEQFFGLK
ncbi:TatD family hydrolase [Patescibacteria group bacterium]|nr:TatD family hydrolase [Patescibacteria group bacterium]